MDGISATATYLSLTTPNQGTLRTNRSWTLLLLLFQSVTTPTSCSCNEKGESTEPCKNNSFIERLHRTLLNEHVRIKERTTWYETVEQMQTDPESYLDHYNTQRAHQGLIMEGQPPIACLQRA